jgi:hypothetical protein
MATSTLRTTAAGALALIAGFAGCQTATIIEPQPICNFSAMTAPPPGAAPTPAEVPAAPAPPLTMPLNAVNVTDFRLTNKIMVESTNARRHPTGTVEVWTRLVNCTDFPLQVEGRTHFLDEVRSPVEDVSAWHRIFLPARSYGVYNESSANVNRVRFYYVELREGQ